MTEEDILDTLDHSNDGCFHFFAELGNAYSYLIDVRLNVFRDDTSRWAIAIERLGFDPRSGAVNLDIYYFGNCLINLDICNSRTTNIHRINPIDSENFNATTDGEAIRPEATFWLVRGQPVMLSHDKKDYLNCGIDLAEHAPQEIRIEEATRLAIIQNQELFRATDSELYKSIPPELKKVMVLDEWYHKDYTLQFIPTLTDEHLRQAFELNQQITGLGGMTFEAFIRMYRLKEIEAHEFTREAWEHNRPSSYQTWQLLAKVIATNDPMLYQPTLNANTHWSHWPDSGSM